MQHAAIIVNFLWCAKIIAQLFLEGNTLQKLQALECLQVLQGVACKNACNNCTWNHGIWQFLLGHHRI